MKEKLLQFFTGKMGKAVYISIASAVVCGVVVITSTVIVHNNNKKIDSVLESLSASESVAELSSESVTESISDTDNTDSGAQAKAPNGEPAGDKAVQYLAEYDKLTAEYQSKKSELEKELKSIKEPTVPALQGVIKSPNISDEEYQLVSKKVEEEDESRRAVYESECVSANQHRKEIEKQLKALDKQYEKDIAELKARYGIA